MYDLTRRPRRLRTNEHIRSLVRETSLSLDDLVMPVFLSAQARAKQAIASMPGLYQYPIEAVDEEIDVLLERGVTRVILFGIPAEKDTVGSDTFDEGGVIQRSIRHLRERYGDALFIVTDVCFCEYTTHGHCGVVDPETGALLNDATLVNLGRQAVSHAQAGADMVAPSGMLDGMIGAIRSALDDEDFTDVSIMSYAVKYASSFYGPFRDAVDSAPEFGDRRAYQMDPANAREALVEAALDVEQGADVLMVKPALSYLDVISRVKEAFELPVACYNVSGEYSLVKAAAAQGWVDESAMRREMLLSMKRAGADIIITYFARDIALELERGR